MAWKVEAKSPGLAFFPFIRHLLKKKSRLRSRRGSFRRSYLGFPARRRKRLDTKSIWAKPLTKPMHSQSFRFAGATNRGRIQMGFKTQLAGALARICMDFSITTTFGIVS